MKNASCASAEDFFSIVQDAIRAVSAKLSESESHEGLVDLPHQEILDHIKSKTPIVNMKAARQYVVKTLSLRSIKLWFSQEKLKQCPLPGLLPVIEQCLLFSLVYSWKIERNEIEFKEIEIITESIFSDVSDMLLFCTKTVPHFIRNFFELYEPPSATSFPREIDQLNELGSSMYALSATLEQLKHVCDVEYKVEHSDHWFEFVTEGCRCQDRENKNILDFYAYFTKYFSEQNSDLQHIPTFNSFEIRVIHNQSSHALLHHQTQDGFAKNWTDAVFEMQANMGISKLNKDHVSTTGLVDVASAFLRSEVHNSASQQLAFGIRFVIRAATMIVGLTDFCASVVDHALRFVKFVFFGRDFGLSYIPVALRELGKNVRQQSFKQVRDTFYMMGSILGNERSRLHFPVRSHFCPTSACI
jgi:hypothetical protein